jgi:hypothetical protein
MAYEALFHRSRYLTTVPNQAARSQQATVIANQADQSALIATQRNAAMTSPDLAKGYMGTALLATQANAAFVAAAASAGSAGNATNEAQQAAAAAAQVAVANQAVQATQVQAAGHFASVDENLVAISPAVHHVVAEALRASAAAAAAAAANVGPPSVQTAQNATLSRTSVEDSQRSAQTACTELGKAQRTGASLDPNLAGLSVQQRMLVLAAQQAAADQAVTNSIQTTGMANNNPPNLAALNATIDQDPVANVQTLQTIAVNSVKPRNTTPITNAFSQNNFRKAIESAKELSDESAQGGNAVQASAAAMAQAAKDLAQHNTQLVVPVGVLGNHAAAVAPAAQAASRAIPYDSGANAVAVKDCIDAADAAHPLAAQADAVVAPVDQAILELTAALADLGRQRQALVDAAKEPYRESLTTGVKRLAELKKGMNKMTSDGAMKGDEAVIAIRAALAVHPHAPVGLEVCPDGAPKKLAQQVLRQKALMDAAAAKNRVNIDAIRGIDNMPDHVAGVSALKAQIDEGEALLVQLQLLSQSLAPEVARARAAAVLANQAKDLAVDTRIAQLSSEGHGPQRHEGQVTPVELGQRAVYKIDPETHTQVDAESGELHSADAVASKFNSKEIYVLAESMARAALLLNPPVNDHIEQLIPLTVLGPENQVASGVESTWDPAAQPRMATDKGPARQIPTVQPWVPDSPPPNQLDMDQNAMQVEIAAHSQAVDFRGGQAKAIYRRDINGNWYLRTMWSEKRP